MYITVIYPHPVIAVLSLAPPLEPRLAGILVPAVLCPEPSAASAAA